MPALPTFLRLLLVLAALPLLACGKPGGNIQGEPSALFPHVYPLAPTALSDSGPAWTTGSALAVRDNELVVVDRDNGALVLLDRADGAVLQTIPVGARPEQVVVGPDDAVWATVRNGQTVVRLPDGADAPTVTVELAGQPLGLALSRDGATLYVTLHATGEIAVLDAKTGAVLQQVTVGELLRGISAGAEYVLVAQQTGPALVVGYDAGGSLLSTGGASQHELRLFAPEDLAFGVFDTSARHRTRATGATIEPDGYRGHVVHIDAAPGTEETMMAQVFAEDLDDEVTSSGGYGAATAPDDGTSTGPFSFVPPARPVRPMVSTVDESDWAAPNLPGLPVKDPASGEPMLALVDQPAAAAHHPTHSLLFVPGEGTDNVLVLNSGAEDPMTSPVAIIDVGEAPRAVAFSTDGSEAYVLNGHGFTVSRVDLTPLFDAPLVDQRAVPGQELIDFGSPTGTVFMVPVHLAQAEAWTYGVDPASEAVRRGRRAFTFAGNERLSHAGQFACATCHLEGTEDKLVWMITDGPRQTPALAGRLEGNGPFNWTGSKPELQGNMVQTVDRMGGLGLSTEELDDLEAFLLDGMDVPPNPYLRKSGLTPQQELGKVIFYDPDVGCADCHVGGTMTDGLVHDVGTAGEVELEIRAELIARGEDLPPPGTFNTPSLQGLWRSAPYLHDGSSPTLEDTLDRTSGQMGNTSHLLPSEMDALVAYLLTL